MFLKKSLIALASVMSLMLFNACSDSGTSSGEESNSSSSSINSSDSEQYVEGYTYVSVTEIMYNAPNNSPLEWIELKIVSGKAIDNMVDYALRLEGAVNYVFPAEPLDVDEYIIVANDVEMFKKEYPDFKGRVFGPWEEDPKTPGLVAKLSNEGDVIDVKITGKGDVSCAFSKEPPWPSLADGNGHSLVFVGGNPIQAASWAASKKEKGNPGAADEHIVPTKVRLNEIQPFVLGTSNGWIELYNAGEKDTDISGWIFESKYKGASWTIKKGIVPAKGYLVIKADDVSVFGEEVILNVKGGEYYLYEVVNGKRTGSESSLLLAASELSSGIIDISDGSTAQGALETTTEGKANAALKAGPIFIDEIYYHPAIEGNAIPFEFLELVNKSDADVNLYVTKNGKSKGWKVEGINIEFGSGMYVPANGRVVLLSDTLAKDTAAIRKDYSIDKNIPLYLYKGKLSNRGELIAVKKPFDFDNIDAYVDLENPEKSTPAYVQWYYDWSDASLYSDSWEGLKEADGFGYSLQRTEYKTMGYESSSWKAGAPTLGK